MSKRAVILAGGLGTRLRPYTVTLPKPLMPVGEYPILEIIVRQLAMANFTHLTFAVNHQAEIIKAFFGDGKKWGLHIDYSLEEMPLGTMGPLLLIDDLPDDFLVMNGDILTDINYEDFYKHHIETANLFTISSYVRNQLVDYGVLDTSNNRLISLREKPVFKYEVSMGVYMVSKSVLSFIRRDTPYGFDQLMHDLLEEDKPISVSEHPGYWLDIGRPDDYATANDVFEKNRAAFIGPNI